MTRLRLAEQLDGYLEHHRRGRSTHDHLGTFLRGAGVLRLVVVRHALHRHGALGLRLRGGVQADSGAREGTELDQQQNSAYRKAHGTSVPGRLHEVKLRASPWARLIYE